MKRTVDADKLHDLLLFALNSDFEESLAEAFPEAEPDTEEQIGEAFAAACAAGPQTRRVTPEAEQEDALGTKAGVLTHCPACKRAYSERAAAMATPPPTVASDEELHTIHCDARSLAGGLRAVYNRGRADAPKPRVARSELFRALSRADGADCVTRTEEVASLLRDANVKVVE